MRIDLIVFDWDGTLMDSERKIVRCLSKAIEDVGLGKRSPERLRDVIGLSLREATQRLYPNLDGPVGEQLVQRYRHWFLLGPGVESAPFPGVEDTLRQLEASGRQLAIATGKSRRGLDLELASTQLGRFFNTSRCADEAASKPHPQMLHDIMGILDVSPEHTVMVGDTEFDLEMAQNAGTHSIGVKYGVHHPQRLLRCNPLALLDAITDLPKVL